jgi:hypothetical protein
VATNSDDKDPVSPFPALHTSANAEADEHLAAARKLAEDAQNWLADLDSLLNESPVMSQGATSVHSR